MNEEELNITAPTHFIPLLCGKLFVEHVVRLIDQRGITQNDLIEVGYRRVCEQEESAQHLRAHPSNQRTYDKTLHFRFWRKRSRSYERNAHTKC